jgi:hypothetical protein
MAGGSINATALAGANRTAAAAVSRESVTELPSKGHALSAWIIPAAVALFLVAGFFLFGSTGQDDSYLSYWPAYTLAKFGRIMNYSGQPVEQSSSMLWVLCLGLLAFVTRAPVPLLGPLLSIAGGVLAILVAARLAARVNARVPAYAAILAATAMYLVYWSFSGMETSLAAACTAWLALTYSDFVSGACARKFEVVTATLCCLLVRPEMGAVLGLMLGILVGTIWLRHRRGLLRSTAFANAARRIGSLCMLVVGLSIAIAAIRMLLFHVPVPEPALVKGGRHSHIGQGLEYLWFWSRDYYMLPAACLALIGIVWTVKEAVTTPALSATRLVCSALVIAYGAFIIWVGGDWMVAGRFLVHVLPVALVLAASALVRFAPPRWLVPAAAGVALIQLGTMTAYARDYAVSTSLRHPVHGAPRPELADLSWFDRTNRLFLRDAPMSIALGQLVTRMRDTGHPVTHLFSGQMGIVMYRLGLAHFGEIDVTDRHGLADARFANCGLAARQPRTPPGLQISYPWFMQHLEELERQCQIPTPDIVYDIEPKANSSRVQALETHGYAVIFQKRLDVRSNRSFLRGDSVATDEFIAVRRDLLTELHLQELPAAPPPAPAEPRS